MKTSTMELKNIQIDTKTQQRAMKSKIRIAFNADPHWKIGDLEFREQFYLGHIGFEVTIKQGACFLTEKVQEAMLAFDLKFGTIGLIDGMLMVTIWNKNAPRGGLKIK